MYVPAALVHGKVLYQDVWYPYTPAAPYLNSILFRVFGIHLSVLYWAGSMSALATAVLLYLIGLQVTSRFASWLAGSLLLAEAFVSGIFCFPLPYSFGAVYGCVSACLCIWCILNACSGRRWQWLAAGGAAAACALLSKPEFGVGCFLALALVVAVRGLRTESRAQILRQIGIDLAALLPGAVLSVGVIAWMISLRGFEFLTQDNFMSWPSSYFMKEYGPMWLASTGLAFGKTSVYAIGKLAVVVAVWLAIRWLVTTPRAGGRALGAALLLLAGLAAYAAYAYGFGAQLPGLLLPRAALFLVALAIPVIAWRCWLQGLSTGFVKVAMLFATTVLIAARTMFGTRPEGYSIFYNGPVLLSLLVIMGWLIFPRASRGLRGMRLAGALPYAGLALVTVVSVIPLYRGESAVAPLVTQRGTIYATPGKVQAYQAVLEFIAAGKARGEQFLSVPEDMSLYFLADMDSPTRVYSFTPGAVVPGRMTDQTIAEIEGARVRYLIWSNRMFNEYRVPEFGVDFNRVLGQYLRSHYRPLQKLGGDDDSEWNAVVWERLPPPLT
jgi:hypothetical protein